jgi:methylmalonyl-CoA mutase N-terminal domain/subunit
VDPLAGSWYVETLTNQMEEQMRTVMAEADAQGGIVAAIAEGRIQDMVSRQAWQRQKQLESGEFRKVGVNCYRQEAEEQAPVEFHPFREQDCAEQIARLRQIRAQRNGSEVASALRAVRAAAKAGQNVMPAVIAAVQAYATVGELTQCLVEEYGRYQEPTRF